MSDHELIKQLAAQIEALAEDIEDCKLIIERKTNHE